MRLIKEQGIRIMVVMAAARDMREIILTAKDMEMTGEGWAWMTSGECI